jgi:integrase
MFHLAIDWDLYSDPNPFRKVKYFQGINTGFRVLKPAEETRLLQSATPAIQDIILYALNTGSRIGEIFSLRWQDVDLDQGMIATRSHTRLRKSGSFRSTRKCAGFWSSGSWAGRTNTSSTTRKPESDLLIPMPGWSWPARRQRSKE